MFKPYMKLRLKLEKYEEDHLNDHSRLIRHDIRISINFIFCFENQFVLKICVFLKIKKKTIFQKVKYVNKINAIKWLLIRDIKI